MSVNMRYFWGMVVLNVITTVSAGMLVMPAVVEKAESLYKEAPIEDQTNSMNGAARDLRECLVENNVFVIPFPEILGDTPEPDPIMVPLVAASMCEFTDGNGKPAEIVVQKYKPRQLRKEIKRFHECICREKSYKVGRHCHFNMIQTGYNISVLQEVLGNDTRSTIGILTSGSQEFHCHIKKNYTIVCRIKKNNISFNDTKLHRTLVCLSSALTFHVCGEEHLPTKPTHPPGTTVLPAGNTGVVEKTTLRFVFLGMGCLLFILIGIFTTVCVVRCWRQGKKRRKKKSIVERPRQHARSNSYADNLDHVYTYLPDEVPDILQQSSRTAVHSRFGSERSISVSSTLRSVSYSPSVREQGYYEPLTRQEDVPSLPNRPIPKPRWQISVPEGTSHDYLDLIEEDKMEEQDVTPAGPKYYVLEKPADTKKTKEPGTNKDDFVALIEDQQTPKDQDEDTKIRETAKGKLEDREHALDYTTKKCVEGSVKNMDYFVLESSKGEESGHPITEDLLEDLSDQLDVSKGGSQDDKYEISVPETPSFDLASSFKCKVSPESHDKRQYQDYERILPKLPEEESRTGGDNSYLETLFVEET